MTLIQLQRMQDCVLALTIREKPRLIDLGHLVQIGDVAADPGFSIANDVGIRDHQRPPVTC